MNELRGKTLFITGASRGIGKAIALRAARDGANIVIAAKTEQPHPRLRGTIYSAAEEIEAAGGRSLPCAVDIRKDEQVRAAIDRASKTFGGIDVLVNNASAISLVDTESTEMKRFDLMHAVNVRGTFLTSKLSLPWLLKSENPHILNIAPPLDLQPRWFAPHLAYSLAKFGMSLCVLGMAEEFRQRGIAVSALWPRTIISTAAVENLLGGREALRRCRRPEIMADAAHWILTRPTDEVSGRFFIDEDVLTGAGVTDLDVYSVEPGADLDPDLFV